MMEKYKVLVAGSTGYLGRFITQELINRGADTTIIVRNKNRINLKAPNLKIIEAQVTQPDTLMGVCDNIDIVISSVGITRQKDGLTYMDVDYQANVNLLNEAKKSKVKKIIYISVLNGDNLRQLKIGEAKEKFVDELKTSGLDYCVIRPNGFFSDMADFLNMAKNGRVYLFGNGELKLNPIHGQDLAQVVVDAINQNVKEINIGGPDLLSQNEIGELALKAYSKPVKIIHLPNWIRILAIRLIRIFTGPKTYGPIEFFLTTMNMDMTAPKYGKHHIADFFNERVKSKHSS
ncbi:3-beta hydroxysteroid dehydrogenase [Prevotella herbatica]|uniref:Divinyl chlorophyllide a 8-vinyl-reductase, chloroplastic n=2 Tax=Prevotella herbatica TaxID=2801997 RepID=A0ABN6EM27_9BACT|nr:3-beta hydroxysteroid dehydrogenase [Prevotella herbatica]